MWHRGRSNLGEGMALRGLGLAYRAAGQPQRAREVFLRVLAMARQPRETLLETAVRRDLTSLADPLVRY